MKGSNFQINKVAPLKVYHSLELIVFIILYFCSNKAVLTGNLSKYFFENGKYSRPISDSSKSADPDKTKEKSDLGLHELLMPLSSHI